MSLRIAPGSFGRARGAVWRRVGHLVRAGTLEKHAFSCRLSARVETINKPIAREKEISRGRVL